MPLLRPAFSAARRSGAPARSGRPSARSPEAWRGAVAPFHSPSETPPRQVPYDLPVSSSGLDVEGERMSGFWEGWRKDIVRGAVLFCGVLCIWLVGSYFVGQVRQGVTRRLPMALRNLRNEFDGGSDEGPRIAGGTWSYRAKVAPKQWVWIRNTRGSVTV